MPKNKRGFTIVELLIVIVIIGVLAAVSLVAYNGSQGRARDAQRKTDIANIAKALEMYYSDNGEYPVTSAGLSSINQSWYSSDVPNSWSQLATALGDRIDKLPIDPKNTPGSVMSSGKFSYAYYGGSTYCGAGARQMYILVYRLESAPQEKFTDGTCATNPLGEAYYDTYGVSFYRVVH